MCAEAKRPRSDVMFSIGFLESSLKSVGIYSLVQGSSVLQDVPHTISTFSHIIPLYFLKRSLQKFKTLKLDACLLNRNCKIKYNVFYLTVCDRSRVLVSLFVALCTL